MGGFKGVRQRLNQGDWRSREIALFLVSFLSCLLFTTMAAMSQPTGNAIDGYPVLLGDQPIFRIREGIPGIVSAEERARVVTQRIAAVAASPEISPDSVHAKVRGSEAIVQAGDITLFTVREIDSQAAGQSTNALAEQLAQQIKNNLIQYRRDRSTESLLRAILLGMSNRLCQR
ncbi:MAG TPA: hypothetical protein IGS53_22285 [Leptolyngbyaceae cyanobacterium M33_DOE_097]|uniref:Uncharacterized protein n=1 Tax=Oscillatoriales cyanobacterium SpSt-418 TaxID=2282169 RepID=A0A7C3KAB7_9CYAN|nr:hypothetical protein [Leptolyngbyaceae cyanobacterium M33_DOE_097]